MIYNGLAFGKNAFLRAHTDQDFTYSDAQVHVDGTEYHLDDPIACYFCFPRLGIAVPLRPGDYLLFNALEPHCVSSRCNTDIDVYTMTCYLKTAVVGGNNNQRPLSNEEELAANFYENCRKSK